MKFKTIALALTLMSSSVLANDIVIKNDDLMFHTNKTLARCNMAVARNTDNLYNNNHTITLVYNYNTTAQFARDIKVYNPVKICTVNVMMGDKYDVYLSMKTTKTETTFITTKKHWD